MQNPAGFRSSLSSLSLSGSFDRRSPLMIHRVWASVKEQWKRERRARWRDSLRSVTRESHKRLIGLESVYRFESDRAFVGIGFFGDCGLIFKGGREKCRVRRFKISNWWAEIRFGTEQFCRSPIWFLMECRSFCDKFYFDMERVRKSLGGTGKALVFKIHSL